MGDHDSTKQKIMNESMLTPQRLAELASAKNELTWAYDGLKDPEGRFKLLFDRVFDCCVMIDEKGAIVYANEAACRVLGYAKEQLLNLTARDLHPNKEAEKMQAAASRVLRDGVDYAGETEFIAMNGEVIAVEAGAVSLKLADRSYIVYSFRDITERKRIDDEEADHISDLMSLSRTAMDLVELSTEEDIYQFIGQRLMELAGNSVIIVNSFDEASSTFCLRAIQGVGEHMDSFLKILGRQPIGITVPISKEAKVGLTGGRLEKVPGGLYELADGGLPRSVCNEIETLLGLGDLYAMGFAWKGQLFGSAVVLTRRGAELRNPGIIETFVSQASVALQRWQAEVALRKAHDELEMRVEQRTGDLADAIEKLQLEVNERKRSVEELRVKDSAIASSTNAIAISDLEGNVTYVNPSFLRLWGYESDEGVVGRPAIEFWQVGGQVDATIGTILEKEGWQGEVIALRKDGSAFVAELSANMVADGDGKPMCMMGSLLDITERKRLEDMLRESEEMSRGMLEGATVGMYIVQDGKFLYVNPRFEEISSYTMAELSGADSLEHVHPDDREVVRKKATELLKGRSNTPYELRYICRDGRTLWCLERVASILYKGKPAAVGSFMDITERKWLEEKYRVLVESIPDIIYAVDAAGVMTYVSPTIEPLLGYSQSEVIGKSFAEFLYEEDLQRCTEHFQDTLSGNVHQDEYRVLTKSGQLRWMRHSAKPLSEGDQLIGVRGVLSDVTERKRVEEALKASEERYRLLVDNASDAIIVAQDGMIKFSNPKASETTGYSQEELATTPFVELIHPDDKEMVIERHLRRLEGEELPHVYPFRIIDKNGTLKWLQINAAPLTWEDRPATLNFLSDITERKLAEEALQESEGLYRLLADNASDVIWTMDMNLRFTYVSPAATSLLGYSFEEALAMKIEDFLTPESAEAATKALAEAQSPDKQGEDLLKTRSVEFELIAKDGTRVWTENNMRLLLDPDGQRVGILGVARNITERKRAEEALRESEERFKALFENASDAVAILDAEGIMVYESPSVERILGYRPEELIGKSVLDLVHPDDLPEVTARLASFTNDPTTSTSMELRLRHKDGSWRWVECVANNLIDNPQVQGIVANYRDITERKKADEALRESEERFRALIENASDAVAIVDANGIMVYESPSVERILGYRPEELIGKPVLDFVH
ncbi:MAG: PAS domain S-box protein, partial [Dehalococcoidia bacterium]